MSYPNNGLQPNYPSSAPYNGPYQNPYASQQYGNPYMAMPQNQTVQYSNNPMNNAMNTNRARPNIGLIGRAVNNENEIRPDEVPMDGNVAFFPQSDGSCIYAKYWNNNGLIDKRVYVLAPMDGDATSNTPMNNLEMMYKELSNKIDSIYRMLNRSGSKPYRNNRSRNDDYNKHNSETNNEEVNKNV